jgi:hypothetical protein
MNKRVVTILTAAVLAVSLNACKTGGNSHDGGDVTPTPPAAQPSVSILDVRNLTNAGDENLTVEFDLLVANATGEIVTGLDSDDFIVNSAGGYAPSAIMSSPTSHAVAAATGNYSVTILLDSSDSMELSDPFDLRLSAVNHLGSLLKAGDEAQVIAFAGSADQLRDPVYDLPSQFYDIGPGFGPSIDTAAVNSLAQWENGGSPTYSAVIHGLGTEGIMNASNLAKAVVVLTDGENDNLVTVDEAIAAATQEGFEIPVYALGLGSGANEAELQRLASETGGLYSSVSGAEQLESLMGSIAQVLSTLDPNAVGARLHYTLRVVFGATSASTISGEIGVQVLEDTVIRIPFTVVL